jgi:hypothetical protein
MQPILGSKRDLLAAIDELLQTKPATIDELAQQMEALQKALRMSNKKKDSFIVYLLVAENVGTKYGRNDVFKLILMTDPPRSNASFHAAVKRCCGVSIEDTDLIIERTDHNRKLSLPLSISSYELEQIFATPDEVHTLRVLRCE